MQKFKAIILGGGPAGMAAARQLGAAGVSAALVENRHLGGTCLNCGCIPTKMLLGATAPLGLLHSLSRSKSISGELQVNLPALQKRIQRFVNGTRQTAERHLAALGVTVFTGHGVCAAPGVVQLQNAEDATQELHGENIILACGSSSATFPGLAPDNDAVMDSTHLMRLEAAPKSLIIVGGGAIGLELGDFFHALGTKVTIVEAAPQLAPAEDADIAREFQKILTKSGHTVLTGVMAQTLVTREGAAVLTLKDGTVLTAAKAMIAVGRRPNTADLGCERLGCTLNQRGFVEVNACLEAAPGVYAIGDINGKTLLAHAAEHQAAYVARHILGTAPAAYSAGPVPSCIYGSTEAMRVGATAKETAAAGLPAFVSQAALGTNAIAQAGGDISGFVKAVWAGDDLVGIAAVGHGVSHLVTAAQLLLLGQYHGERSQTFMIAHPTLDELLREALNAPRVPFTSA